MKLLMMSSVLLFLLVFSACATCVQSHDEVGYYHDTYCALYGRKGRCYFYETELVPYTYSVCDEWKDEK